MKGRKAGFWLTVAGVSLLASLGVELAAEKIKNPGLARLVSYIHRGPGGAA